MGDTRLHDIPRKLYDKHRDQMPKRFAKRAEHYYTECERVRQGLKAWKKGDIKKFGQLVFDSCESSMNNYECGSPELIELYKIMRHTDGIFGGRFSGAGFKGACIALIDPDKEESIREQVTNEYLAKFPQYKNSFCAFFCNTSNGVDFL